jgi:hypothetical protein
MLSCFKEEAMTEPRDILIVCPQAVVPAWVGQVESASGRTPWDHQQRALDWSQGRRFLMLAAEMGTGKSLTAVMILDAYGATPVPLGVGGSDKRAAVMRHRLKTRSPGERYVFIVNYDSVWRRELGKTIMGHKWAGIVLDESHRIKSPGGRASRWLSMLAKASPESRLICMTGTPMPHSPLDLYGQFRFLNPEVFGTSFVRFRTRYALCDQRFPGKVRRWLRQDELSGTLDRHAFRVTADDVLDLPEAIHEIIPIALTPKAAKFYRQMERDTVAAIENDVVIANNPLTKLLRLQQATSGYYQPEIGQPQWLDGRPSKRAALEDWLTDLPTEEPVVVFCRFRCDLKEVAAAAEATGRRYAELSGDRRELETWQAGQAEVIGIQIQSGGVGIDLTRAAYCCYYSLGFSLGDYEQSLARLRRPGQTRMVRYYHMVAGGTVDETVYKALRERGDVVNAVLVNLTRRVEENDE